jgi:S1-C subfamily serine protease
VRALPSRVLPAALGAAAVLLAGCTATADRPVDAAAPGPAPTAGTPVPLPEPVNPTRADVVERVAPSVVTVRVPNGLGSGVVYQPDVVLTNQHVVGEAREVTIDYADGTSSPGTVLATDATTDLAVVRTERTGLPVPEYRRELPRPGEEVIAIGSPLGLENTVTAGIVSALDREIPGSAAQSRALVDLIQVDAPISPGNSGGALLDASGRVIGINEAYLPPASGAVSLGFAIPAATAVDVADQLLADGTATHPYLGVSLSRITDQIRDQLGVAAADGALVLSVDPGGPAAAAGLRGGDVIVGLAGEDVDTVERLLGVLRDTEPGQQVPITVARGTEEVTATVTIGSVPG